MNPVRTDEPRTAEPVSNTDPEVLLQAIQTLLTDGLRQKSPEDWLTLEEVAQELKVSLDSIKRICATGKLRSAPVETGSGTGKRFARRIQRRWLNEYMCRDVGLTDATPPPTRSRRRRPRSNVPDYFSAYRSGDGKQKNNEE